MAKRSNFNVPVDVDVAKGFENWADSVPGTKGEKLEGAMIAIQALHAIDSGLAADLMNNTIKIDRAKEMIINKIVAQEKVKAFSALTSEQQDFLLASIAKMPGHSSE